MSSSQERPSIDPEKFRKTANAVAIGALIACPTLALLPPRKLDIYTIGLIATTGYSANYLIQEYSGRSMYQHITRQQRPAQIAIHSEHQSVVGELQKQGRSSAAQQENTSGLYKEGWKAQRQKDIREDVEEGKGFGEMIMDQIWEVCNQGNRTKEEDSEG